MTQLLSLFDHVFGNQSKNKDIKQFVQKQSYFNGIKQTVNHLIEAWLEARSEQAKYYNTHSHIE